MNNSIVRVQKGTCLGVPTAESVRAIGGSGLNGSRWEFSATGEEQLFEELEAYGARRLRDRFTSDMLKRYCLALGLDVFNGAAYGPDAVLIEGPVPMPSKVVAMSLDEAQAWLGIDPSSVGTLVG